MPLLTTQLVKLVPPPTVVEPAMVAVPAPFLVSVPTPLMMPPVNVYALVSLLMVILLGARFSGRVTVESAAIAPKVTLSMLKNVSAPAFQLGLEFTSQVPVVVD